MAHAILGLHHVTATVDDAQDDLDYCIEVLGMRLVKKTVNFDNHHVYHFYYGDERGTPGSLWTTFPYKGWNVPAGERGAGQILATTFSVPEGSLGRWASRLEGYGIHAVQGRPRFGDEHIAFRDPSGLIFEMIAAGNDSREPWVSTIPEESAVRGLHSVTMVVRSPQKTIDLMTGVLGFSIVDEMDGRIRMAVNGTGPGHLIDIIPDERAAPSRNGIGTVHHVALAIAGADEQLALREDLVRGGYHVTEVRDRHYFTSIYFREPGGVLFEVATRGPGFLIDEDLRTLGRELRLPPGEEAHRSEIEAGLPQVSYV